MELTIPLLPPPTCWPYRQAHTSIWGFLTSKWGSFNTWLFWNLGATIPALPAPWSSQKAQTAPGETDGYPLGRGSLGWQLPRMVNTDPLTFSPLISLIRLLWLLAAWQKVSSCLFSNKCGRVGGKESRRPTSLTAVTRECRASLFWFCLWTSIIFATHDHVCVVAGSRE